jgi:hypothetical protein
VNRLEIIGGLVDGKTLTVYDRTSDIYRIVNQLAVEDKVTMELVNLDEQSSVLKVRWKE